MRFYTFFFTALSVMASASSEETLNQPQQPKGEVDNGDGTRDIYMWKDETHTEAIIKFLSVPYTYDLDSIKHAEFVSAITIYNDGQHWLTMKGKRLFRFPSKFRENIPEKYIQPYPSTTVSLMSPEELKEVLANHPKPYALLKQRYDEIQALKLKRKREDAMALDNKLSEALDMSDREGCRLEMCDENSDCHTYSNQHGSCDNCIVRSGRVTGDCDWYSYPNNFVGGGGGGGSRQAEGVDGVAADTTAATNV
jgi:hypothetical protein